MVIAIAMDRTQSGLFNDALGGLARESAASTSDFESLLNQTVESMDAVCMASNPGLHVDTLDEMIPDLDDETLDTLVDSLLSRDLLYQPLNDLCSGYPDWMAKHQPLGDDPARLAEYENYKKQHFYLQELMDLWKRDLESSDDDSWNTEQINTKAWELIHKIQECGPPPTDLVPDINQ